MMTESINELKARCGYVYMMLTRLEHFMTKLRNSKMNFSLNPAHIKKEFIVRRVAEKFN